MALPIGRACYFRVSLVNFQIVQKGRILDRSTINSKYLLQYAESSESSNASRSSELLRPRSDNPKYVAKSERISKAMEAYLQRATAHDAMIKDQIAEYEIGKRHLANIMGEDPDLFMQEDVDRAVQYLLPSGLFEKKARPVMKHPYEIFPRKKMAQFGMDGRPFHFLFYTGKANYYQLMYDISSKIEALNSEEDHLNKKELLPTTNDKKLSLYGSEWISHDTLQSMLVEKFGSHDHSRFVLLLDRLVNHPLSYMEEEFIMKYRRKLASQSLTQTIPKPIVDDEGREFITANGVRKSSTADVTVWMKGTGKMAINGKDLEYFNRILDYEQIMFPLQFLNMLGKVDVVVTVSGGGPTGQSGAIRLALSKALSSFVDAATVEKMRLAGLLQVDYRTKERKKPGQVGARKKYTWKRR